MHQDFLRFILLLFAMLAPIKSLGIINITIQNSLAAADRVFNVLDSESEINDIPNAKVINSFSEEIQFKNVSFERNHRNFIFSGESCKNKHKIFICSNFHLFANVL